MKGIRATIVAEQELIFEPFRLPNAPRESEVLVRIDRTIISAGTELANYTGLEPDTRKKGKWCTYPWSPGYGGIGTIMAVGPKVEDLEPGQRVYGIFKHATHAIVDTSKRLCVPVAKGLDPTLAVMARMGNVAITAYRRADAALGDGVLIIGLGLVGNLAGQFFARSGQRVIGLDPSPRRRQLALQTGFAGTLDPGKMRPPMLSARVKALNRDASPRIVVDAVGDSRIVELSMRLVATGGQVILLGTPRAPYETDCTPMLSMAHKRGIVIKGALEWIVPLLKRRSSGVSTESNAELILRMIADGSIHVAPLVTHVIPPGDLDCAYQGLLHQKDGYVGVVLDWENYPPPEVTPAAERAQKEKPGHASSAPGTSGDLDAMRV